jgi:hypothetical protein
MVAEEDQDLVTGQDQVVEEEDQDQIIGIMEAEVVAVVVEEMVVGAGVGATRMFGNTRITGAILLNGPTHLNGATHLNGPAPQDSTTNTVIVWP